MSTTSSFVNGKPQASLSLNDRGVNYGHGLFETMYLSSGQLPLWHYHRQRLHLGADRLGISLDSSRLDTYLQQALEAVPSDGILKILLTAGLGPRGYRQQCRSSSYAIQYFPFPPVAKAGDLRLQRCNYALPHNAQLAGIKHLNRLDQVLAADELKEGYDGLLLDVDGNVIEALSSNIFLFDGQNWLTPELDLCGVAGVMRRLLCEEIMPNLGLHVIVKPVSLASLLNASEVFACNAVRGIQPVYELAGLARWSFQPSGSETAIVMKQLSQTYPYFRP